MGCAPSSILPQTLVGKGTPKSLKDNKSSKSSTSSKKSNGSSKKSNGSGKYGRRGSFFGADLARILSISGTDLARIGSSFSGTDLARNGQNGDNGAAGNAGNGDSEQQGQQGQQSELENQAASDNPAPVLYCYTCGGPAAKRELRPSLWRDSAHLKYYSVYCAHCSKGGTQSAKESGGKASSSPGRRASVGMSCVVCMYVSMYLCIYVCMYLFMYV
jgi:hypothetical protein